MTSETRRGIIINIIYIQTSLCTLLSIFMASHGTETDIFCLKSIKDSLEDPSGYLSSSWDFNNNAEGFRCGFVGVGCWHPGENRVLTIDLSNTELKGKFPRGLQNCSSLTGLDLSSNELSGPIRSDISALLPFATSIRRSNDNFSGEIPVDLANCAYLNSLDLGNNMFSGQIPQELGLLTRIVSISLGNNNLSGPVPAFRYGSGTVVSYVNNVGLCGGPLAPCSSLDSSHRPMGFILHQSLRYGLGIQF